MAKLPPAARPVAGSIAAYEGRLSTEQVATVQRIHALSDTLNAPWPIMALYPAVRPTQVGCGSLLKTRYPVDAKIMAKPGAEHGTVALIGVGHLWALRDIYCDEIVQGLRRSFDRFALPSWNFEAYPPVVRELFQLYNTIWFRGGWGGELLSRHGHNTILRDFKNNRPEECLDLEPDTALTNFDKRVATAATIILPTVIGSTLGVLPWPIFAAYLSCATTSLFVPHKYKAAKAIIHPVGDALVHRRSRLMSKTIDEHLIATPDDPRPLCVLTGSLGFLGVHEQLLLRGYRELTA